MNYTTGEPIRPGDICEARGKRCIVRAVGRFPWIGQAVRVDDDLACTGRWTFGVWVRPEELAREQAGPVASPRDVGGQS